MSRHVLSATECFPGSANAVAQHAGYSRDRGVFNYTVSGDAASARELSLSKETRENGPNNINRWSRRSSGCGRCGVHGWYAAQQCVCKAARLRPSSTVLVQLSQQSGSKGFKKHLVPEAKSLEKGKMKEVQVEVEPGKKKAILLIKVGTAAASNVCFDFSPPSYRRLPKESSRPLVRSARKCCYESDCCIYRPGSFFSHNVQALRRPDGEGCPRWRSPDLPMARCMLQCGDR